MSRTGTNDPEVVVVGGGLAGLIAANYVADGGYRVKLLEARSRLGGRASTDERNGFHFNQGPHALYQGGKANEVLTELGIRSVGGPPPSGGKIMFDGQLFVSPTGPMSLLRTRALGLRAKTELGRVFAALPKIDPSSVADLSAEQWMEQQVIRKRARGVLSAVIRLSTYAGRLDLLSADAAVSQLQLGLKGGVLYLDGGWQRLVDDLERRLRATGRCTIETSCKVTERPDVPVVILALNSPHAVANLLECEIEVGPPALATCLDLGLKGAPRVSFALGGDGPLYFSNHSLGANLAPDEHHLVSVLSYLSGPDERVERTVLDQFAAACGVQEPSIIEDRFLHQMVAASSITMPQYGGMAGRPRVDQFSKNQSVLVAGDWVGPYGLLADASFASGRAAGQIAARWIGS